MAATISVKKKICLLGDSAVGKTSLIKRFVLDQFDTEHVATIGTKVTKKSLNIKHPSQQMDVEMTLMIWDVIGQIGFRKMLHEAHFNGAKGGIHVCDITRKDTLVTTEEWIDSLREIAGEIPIVLLSNKSDLKNDAEFGETEFAEMASKYNAYYFFTSAKNGDNVEEAFRQLSQKIIG